ncbi:MAG: glutamate--tRNA ligase [Candidatus Paceibacterota bacterium]
MHKEIITRMPPSPTGMIHVGNIRTLLFNYLFARKHGGKVVFRSEDTDRVRSKREYEEANINDFAWLGLTFDEFYRQSERTAVYQSYLKKLIDNNTAYISPEDSKISPGKIVEVIRLRNPNKTIVFNDVVRGDITFDTTELGDIVIARSIDEAVYHFTVVVDDFEMDISHVIRGEDHISNTPRQILIQEAIGAHRPIYAHVPLILAPDRSKLSKRHGAVSISEYREEGFVASAIVNYLALLGWNPGTEQEIFTLEELIEAFSLDAIQKGSAVFDKTKFQWINKEHLAKLDDKTYFEMVQSALPQDIKKLPQYGDDRLYKLLPVIKERVHTMRELTELAKEGEYDFAFQTPTIDPKLIKWKKDNDVTAVIHRLSKAIELLENADFTTPESIKNAIWPYAEEVGKGELLWPMRTALTGRERSPDPFTCAYILGSEETISRIKKACVTIDK